MRLVSNGPGLGDGIVLSAVTHVAHAQRPGDSIEVVVPHPELWRGNPSIAKASRWRDAWAERSFPEFDGLGQGQCREHQVQVMCRKLGLEPPELRDVRPWIYLSPVDMVDLSGPYVTVHCQSAGWTPNRDWPMSKWAHLVRGLRRRGVRTVQIGGPDDQVLACDTDFRGQAMRSVAACIAGAMAHVCPITGTMHMAAAVGTTAVVAWSSREDPTIIAYPNSRVVQYRPPMGCAPCWKVEPCPHGGQRDFGVLRIPCMEGISVDDMLTAVTAFVESTVGGDSRRGESCPTDFSGQPMS